MCALWCCSLHAGSQNHNAKTTTNVKSPLWPRMLGSLAPGSSQFFLSLNSGAVLDLSALWNFSRDQGSQVRLSFIPLLSAPLIISFSRLVSVLLVLSSKISTVTASAAVSMTNATTDISVTTDLASFFMFTVSAQS